MDVETLLIGFGIGLVFVFFLFSFRTWVDQRQDKKAFQPPKRSFIQKIMAKTPPKIFVDGKEVLVCSDIKYHNIHGEKCVWCLRSVVDIMGIKQAGIISEPPFINPMPDFNSPTTATVNPIPRPEFVPIEPPAKPMSSINAYCLKCKGQVSVLDPQYFTEDTRKGPRAYLHGTCAVCGSRINAIIKRG